MNEPQSNADPVALRDDASSARGLAVVVNRMPALTQYMRIIRRWRWLIAGSIALVFILGLIITMLMQPYYTAKSTLEIARESDNIVQVQGVQREAAINDLEFYQTQYGLLKSQSLAESVVTTFQLADDPAFFELYGVTLNKAIATQLANGKFSNSGAEKRRRIAGRILLDNLKVSPINSSRLVDVKFSSPDPVLAAKVANGWGEHFIRSNLARRVDRTAYARKFLEERLVQLRQKLEESERQLVENAADQQIITFSTGNGGANEKGGGEERSITTADLEQLNTALAEATSDRIRAQSELLRTQSTGDPANNASMSGLRQRRAEVAAEYAKLMVQFEPGYPPAKALASQIAQLDRSIGSEEARMRFAGRSTLESAYRSSVARENGLKARVDGLKNSVLEQRRRGIQYTIYQREVDTNRQLYDGLLQRYKEIGVAGGVGTNNIAIVDTASVPGSPSSPNFLLNLGLALFAGLGVAAALTFALEQIDETISDPSRIEEELGIPALGAIPLGKSGDILKELSDRKSPVAEAYMSLQTSLEFATSHGFPRSLSITSTRASEGKSTTSFALAQHLARIKRRVILIDGDLRSPSVHDQVSLKNKMGVSNYLAGSDALDDMIQRVEGESLHVMTTGPIPPNAAELLNGPRLGQLIKLLLSSYDHVIVDAPPVLGLADALLIAKVTEGTIYVISSHSLKLSMIRMAVGRMKGVGANIIGGVLTKFDEKRAYYGYGYEYGYGYGSGAKDTPVN
jgi:polysaccharide biosynthesis transport protein